MPKKAKVPSDALKAKNFLNAYIANQRPHTTHLYQKGIFDFLVGMLIGVVIGIILAKYL